MRRINSVTKLPVTAPTNQRLYDYFENTLMTHGSFERQYFDPIDIPQLLSHIALAKVERKEGLPPEFRWVVFGTHLVDQQGWDLTGKRLSPEVIGDNFERIIPIYRAVVARKCPILSVERLSMPGRSEKTIEVLHLPMTDGDGGDVVQVLVGWAVIDQGPFDQPLEGECTTWSVERIVTASVSDAGARMP